MDTYVTGITIKTLREKKGLTQTELADILGVSSKAISKWETAKGLPDISLIEPLANALSVSVMVKPLERKIRKSGTGCVYQINDTLWEGSYYPRLPDGKRKKFNVYAKTKEECEKLLAEMIEKKKAEIKKEKASNIANENTSK